ncbi:hypothetical protein BHE74_00046036 [Ensete ventricosum]|uniref:Uncharacterized protein n=1 Tax=Ensete ventricosum TaxID=4639 RepID=A0A444D7Q4_ENSVE|nr:hypothetical protein B296_00010626 [Ensete ventricosum]RWV94176.1 hypothetical protein GW17_00043308 [Ensete ventricosum]RWW47936.1 hypothetical protein BHE74_00046036 [Ensete ventricosum]RZR97061.1 hypothetical protein BHM03_00026174 [Ensete ventricosum]
MGVWESILGKAGRRFIKRKDSDAGENGTLLFFDRWCATSATSHVVLGQFKTCVIMLGGYVFFNSDPGMVSLCGAVVALSGMSLYTYLNMLKESAAASKKLLPKQNSFSLKPKSTMDDKKVVMDIVDSV